MQASDTLTDIPLAATVWQTSADQTWLFEPQFETLAFQSEGDDIGQSTITINPEQQRQTIEGFGYTLTGGSALLISRLPAAVRQALLEELFLPNGDGIGVSFLRLSIGASDLSERSYSYDDLADDETDFELARFDLQAGDREVVPLLQAILALNPAIKIIATPWSAPRWMKTNAAWVGGSLKPECQPVYAAYFVKYLLAMRARGIAIHAVTPQNEPQNYKNDPSMVMSAEEQADFVRLHLGPALADAGLAEVEVFCWDHNCDVPEYPLTVLADDQARAYFSGSAWHLYGGDIAVLSQIHAAHPDKKLYFTEQWVGSDGQFGGDLLWHVKHVLIGATRHWASVVLEWNLASDPHCRPHTAGGEARCVGALTIDGDQITRNVAYYIIAHAAKWVRPGSLRLETDADALPNVAFLTPDDRIVLIVLNDTAETRDFRIRYRDLDAPASLAAGTVATYVWRA
ncbi:MULTISPECIES: glycoside hydrolase family 30 protein [Methylomonas]|uniref:Glucosylceramidase n=1 Tax=Methylomonas koyamae TaxID=702114 RepID=A0A177NM11_9GAMM|nr:glycoside hydrolase family 30 beta sandwich domain-containing protein [Methylomonas koyamae]OAI19166.1 glucosylceramidase [Methylomonas koyamae]